MSISAISSGQSSVQQAKPAKPQAPTPPPGGNIEHRQPPPEPSALKNQSVSASPSLNSKFGNFINFQA